MRLLSISIVSAVIPVFVLSVSPASADEVPPTPAVGAAASASASASAKPKADAPVVSLALERFGGIAYAKASESEGRESSVSLFTMGLGVGTLNPYAVPRLGVDYITSSGLSLGGAVGLARWSGSTSSGSRSEDVGSIFLYTLTPRAGYRLPLSERVDLTLRGGVTFAGGSLSNGEDEGSSSLFSVGLGLDAPFAFRVTDSFNLLAGPAFDVMVTGTSSSTTRSGNSTSSSDIKGALWSLQGWLGVGGYL